MKKAIVLLALGFAVSNSMAFNVAVHTATAHTSPHTSPHATTRVATETALRAATLPHVAPAAASDADMPEFHGSETQVQENHEEELPIGKILFFMALAAVVVIGFIAMLASLLS